MTVSHAVLLVAVAMLAVAAGLALFRLARGPSSLDRAVASDVVLVVVALAAAVFAAWTRTPQVLTISLVLSLLGFTSAVGLARLITGATVTRRRFEDASARAGKEGDQ